MKIHVLPGDALAENFKDVGFEGEIVICRECLIEGGVAGKSLDSFWKVRADFISSTYGGDADDYKQNVAGEFEKLRCLPADAEVSLWFEYDLFCQTNMWFCLSVLENTAAEIYRVAPTVKSKKDVWKGFGGMDAEDLQECFKSRVKFGEQDVLLGANLWKAYQNDDFAELKKLGKIKSECFPHLEEVCQAEIEKRFRPQNALKEIISNGETDFIKLFEKFSEKEPIYGFGDAQVKNIYDALTK